LVGFVQEGRIREIENVMGLLLFADPSKSPDAALLSNTQRENTSQQLNAALLKAQGYSPGAALQGNRI
jgi:hypothetical protein